MPAYTVEDIHNIALVGHAGSGKTTLTEAILHAAGAIGDVGTVEDRTTVCDYTDEEKEHGLSLQTSIVHCQYNGKHINLIDTPGSADFIGHALAVLPAAETVAVVINAQTGIESTTRRMIECIRERKLCGMIIINKIDAENVDLETLVSRIRETFGNECLPMNLPTGGATSVIDVFNKAEGDSDFSSVAEAHTAIVDQVVEVDEDLMARYLEEGEVDPSQLHEPFEKALREGHLLPIYFVSARRHDDHKTIGVRQMLDMFVKLAPNPTEGNPRPFQDGDTEFHAEPDPAKPALAHVFKIANDRFGKLSIFRVHQGTVKKGQQLYIGEAKKPVKIAHLFKLQGGEHKEVDEAIPGDIAAVIKVEELHFDGVLHEDHDTDHVHLKPLNFPSPMYGLAVTAKSRGDEAKIGDALHKIEEEEPCLTVTYNEITHERVINGMGEMHLRVILERLKHKYGVEVETTPPKIAYRETIQMNAEGHHRHKKQSGGAGQFGEVYLRVEPMERGSGFEFSDDIFGGSIPGQFIPAVEKGVRQVMDEGCVAGYPMQDIKVSVYDGKHHPVDSKEVAFVTAAKKAFQDAVNKARPALLEPIVNVEVTCPNANMGDITGDLSGKRGRIQGTDMLPGDMAMIKALVPLSEMMNYHSQLKSVTGGQGSYVMEFSHYDPVPGNVQQQIVSQYLPRPDED